MLHRTNRSIRNAKDYNGYEYGKTTSAILSTIVLLVYSSLLLHLLRITFSLSKDIQLVGNYLGPRCFSAQLAVLHCYEQCWYWY
jgi:hypothetical protein